MRNLKNFVTSLSIGMMKNKAHLRLIFGVLLLLASLILPHYAEAIFGAYGNNGSHLKQEPTPGGLIHTKGKVKASETVRVFIGENRFTLYGYTSPFAHVTLEGQGIFDETTADKHGYFIFKNRFSPGNDREACLIAKDTQGRVSFPVCLPPFPMKKNVTIGPIILSPSLSLNRGLFTLNDRGTLDGMSIPNTKVAVSFFGEQAEAITINTITDTDGNFSVNFPTDHPQTMRAIATTRFQEYPSGISNTITIDVLPWWMIFLTFLGLLLSNILKNALTYIFILELLVLGLLIWLKWYKKGQVYPLALRPEHELGLLRETGIIPEEKHPLSQI